MLDISYNRREICPICEQKLKSVSPEKNDDMVWFLFCPNGCYNEKFSYGYHTIEIFDLKLNATFNTSLTWKRYLKQMEEAISYWRENDRYLMKIMIGDSHENRYLLR
jgi:hypothetical protein